MNSVMLSSIQFYSASCYPVFERVGFESAKQAADFCSDWSQHEPLWIENQRGEFTKKTIPGFGDQSSVFAMAVMGSFIVWSLPDPITSTKSELLSACARGYDLYRLENG